jgi:hypothetical protein
MMSKRSVFFSDTYTPGKSRGATRQVTIDDIPGEEVTYDGLTDIHLTFDVAARIDTLLKRALRSNDLPCQRIRYTPVKRRDTG